jgi:hypothetical protein
MKKGLAEGYVQRQLVLKAYVWRVKIAAEVKVIAAHPSCSEREQDILLHRLTAARPELFPLVGLSRTGGHPGATTQSGPFQPTAGRSLRKRRWNRGCCQRAP